MSVRILAKFRCMSVARTWDHKTIVEFRPISRGKGKDPENELFWNATPSGESSLTYQHKDPGFEPGAYYHITMYPDPKGAWQLMGVTHREKGGSIDLHQGWQTAEDWDGPVWGSLKMDIGLSSTIDLFGEAGKKWRVEFTFSEPSDG